MNSKILISFSLIIILSGCSLFRPSPNKLFKRAVKNQPYDVIIVPGVPFEGTEWTMAMRGRVIWASYLIKKGIAKNVIFSGGAVYTPYVEARIMALYAEQLGVPKEKIILEEKAEHSTENIYNSYWLAKEMGFTKIAVATDMFQSKLLMGFTNRRFKLPIAHIPFVVDTLKTIHDVNPVIDPSSAKVDNFKSIVETQTKRYRWRGTRGKNIKFRKE
ncbi:MAG: YdcF family protein [Bacteroidetes bacterium]|nr:YdcF family protein [Bacteroidota bacterium]